MCLISLTIKCCDVDELQNRNELMLNFIMTNFVSLNHGHSVSIEIERIL